MNDVRLCYTIVLQMLLHASGIVHKVRYNYDTLVSQHINRSSFADAPHRVDPLNDLKRFVGASVPRESYDVSCRMPQCRREGCSVSSPAADCCSAHMFKMLQDVGHFLTSRNYTYFLVFGTLLGAVRDHAIIPWTSDIDIYVPEPGFSALLQEDALPGYKFFFYEDYDGVLRGCPDDPSHAAVNMWDNFNFDIYAPKYIDWKNPHCDDIAKIDSVKEARKVDIHDHWFPTVNHPLQCLSTEYGSDYMTPDHPDWEVSDVQGEGQDDIEDDNGSRSAVETEDAGDEEDNDENIQPAKPKSKKRNYWPHIPKPSMPKIPDPRPVRGATTM